MRTARNPHHPRTVPQLTAALLLLDCAAFPRLPNTSHTGKKHATARHRSTHKAAAKASVKVWVNTKTGVYHYPFFI